jgi:hypothetical protein
MDIIPSFYRTRDVGDTAPASAFANTKLRPGEVVGVIHPKSPKSRSHKFMEYEVYVQHRENGTAVTQLYHAVVLADMLGGRADTLRYLLRGDQTSQVDGKSHAGSKVLVLCINGAHSDAVILGGFRDDTGSDLDIEATELARLDFAYNGVAASIGDDGSLSLAVDGATDAEGALRQGVDANGATLSVTPDGAVEVASGADQGKEALSLDPTDGSVKLLADQTVTVKAGDSATIEAGTKATVKAQTVVLDGMTKLGSEQAAEAFLKGTTFRAAQAALHTQLIAAATAGAAASVGPLSAYQPAWQAMLAAYQAFEAQAATFLSVRVSGE